jgi:deoxyxylulose-5-phosphate synthase
MNIYSASSSRQIRGILHQCLYSKNSNYVRLERKVLESADSLFDGYREAFFQSTYSFPGNNKMEALAIISYGQIMRRVHELKGENSDLFEKVRIVEISKLWPLEIEEILNQVEGIDRLMILEEQSRSGSISEAISFELITRNRAISGLRSFHLPNRYIFENGNQEELLDEVGFSKSEILQGVKSMLIEDKL